MTGIIPYIYIAIVALLWIYNLIKSPEKALCVLIIAEVIYINYFSTINVDFIIKTLMLFTNFIAIFKYGFRGKKIFTLFFLATLFAIGFIGAKFSSIYSVYDNVTAYMSTFNGFIILTANWPNNNRNELLKKVSYIPLFSIIIGILIMPLNLIPFFTRLGNVGIGGASMATNLSFFAFVGIISSLSLYKYTSEEKYRHLAYINFFIILLTLTRGGIVAGFIALIPDLVNWLKNFKNVLKSRKKIIVLIIIALASIYPLYIITNLLISRSFVNGKFSTSGRVDAWKYIISLVQNKYYGNGTGYLKTMTDSALRSFTAAHNEYVRIYFETGMLGILTHICLFYNSFKLIIKNAIIKKSSIIFFILAFLTYSVTDNTITNFRCWIPFVFVMALIGSDSNEKNKKDTINIKNSTR